MQQEPMDSFRLSPQQRQVWSDQAALPAAFRVDGLVRISGSLDAGRLAAAVAWLGERYEILRTTFRCPQGLKIPLQMIAPAASARLHRVDLTGLGRARGEELAGELFERSLRWPFELTHGPLARFCLVEISASENRLLLSLPAVCADQATLDVLVEEIGRFHAGEALDGETLQYADLAEWANELVESEEAEELAPVWQQRLSTQPPFSLPFGGGSPREGGELRPACVLRWLDEERTVGLRRLGQGLGRSVETLLPAAWVALLRRLAGSPEVALGMAADGRRLADVAHAVGPLTRFLPTRFLLTQGDSFTSLLALVAATQEESRRWQEYFDWSRLESAGSPPRPVFGFDFRADRPPADGFHLDRSYSWSERFAARLSCRDQDASLELTLYHDRSQLDPQEAERLLDRFVAILDHVVRDSSCAVGELDILTESERRQLLREVEAARLPVGSALAHELIGEQARRAPERTAVVFDDQRLTYAQLDRLAERLAGHLRELGVGPEVVVGVYMERSLALVTGLLGILKAGGAFLPLDSEYPQERLTFLLEDSGAPVLLCQPRLHGRLPRHAAIEVLWDDDGNVEAGAGAPVVPPGDGSLAYVIYTSGSTGTPKGTLITHGSLRNYLAWVQHAYPLTGEDRVLQKTPLSFDVAVRELLWPLAAGATLVLAQLGGQRDPSYLARLCARQKVSVLNFVPSQLAVFLEDEAAVSCTALVRVLSGGEELPGALVERFFSRSGASLHNHYGPTETTITATSWTCRPGEGGRRVPIGLPLANTRLCLFDELLQPVPFGHPGEVAIGGAGLARGYLARPELTAERFIPDPFAVVPGDRLFRTGDLARRGPQGALEFLGRIDHQVKVRGFRIELGEIEHVLLRHAEVREAVVTVDEDPSGNKRLLAYVVPAGPGFSADELRAHASASLPDYMVPSRFVRLDALPLSPNGKVDRKALPEPGEMGTGTSATAPRTPTEDYLLALWREFLGIGEISADDDFFQLGGHSLLATQVVSRVRETLQTELSLRSLFEAPTPALLARRIDALLQGGHGPEMPAIRPIRRDGEMPLSFAQQRLWFIDHLQPGSSAYNVPMVVRLHGLLDPAALERALGEIVRRHEPLRTLFLTRRGEPLQVICEARPVRAPVVDLGLLPEALRQEEIRRLLSAEINRPMDIASGPLLRLCLLREGAEGREHVALLTFHHIVTDGWSTGIFVREMAALYGAFVAGRPSPLPELPIHYADFAAWQVRCFEEGLLDSQLAYWTRALDGAPAALRLPVDRPRTETQSFRGAELQRRLPLPLAEALVSFGRAEKVTPFMTLLTVFNVLLHHATGEEDIVVGTDVANRNRKELEGLIGFFVNNLALRADLSGNPSFRELLQRVRRMVITAYVNQDVPFDKLVEKLRPERRLGQMPLFQVLIVLQNQPAVRFDATGLELEILPLTLATTKFDLALFLRMDDDGLATTWVYKPDLFEASTITRMAEVFDALLATVLAEPDARLSQLDLLQRAERQDRAQRKAQREREAFKRHLKPEVVSLEVRADQDKEKLGGR
jgi:amino acid adenylation domain-containing protein